MNGTWFQNGEMARVDYETLLVNYERYRTDRSRMVVSSSADPVSLIPWEEDITILNDVRLCSYIKFKVSVLNYNFEDSDYDQSGGLCQHIINGMHGFLLQVVL